MVKRYHKLSVTVRYTSVSTMIAIALYREDLECSQVPIHKAAALQPGLRLISQYVPINAHATWHAQLIASNGNQKEDKTLLQHSQLSQHGEFPHVSVSERQ